MRMLQLLRAYLLKVVLTIKCVKTNSGLEQILMQQLDGILLRKFNKVLHQIHRHFHLPMDLIKIIKLQSIMY